MQKDLNWIHFTGIAGVALAPLAIEFHKLGYKVTGSDFEIYEPIKTLLANSKIPVFDDYSYKNILEGDIIPELIVAGAGVSPKNKELLFAKKHDIQIRHYAEILEELLIEKESIVVAGTYAKTTITAMIVGIFKNFSKEISFMFGGIPVDGSNSVHLKTSKTLLSVVEGDEYIASRWDKRSKFFFYHPKYLILTAINWDHTDVFTSEKDYVENFRRFIEEMPEDAVIFANFADKNVVSAVKDAKCKVIEFRPEDLLEWAKKFKIEISILGSFNLLNAAIAAKFASEVLGIDIEWVKIALKNFLGIKRRLEIRYSSENIRIIDDFASSPSKIKGSIGAIKDSFPDWKFIIVYEPNTGNRTKAALSEFNNVFDCADMVLLPKFKKLISSRTTKFLDENEFAKGLKSKTEVIVRNDDEDLVNTIFQAARNEKSVVAFLSSQAMEDRIQLLISKY
ncbi:hypothetical protein JW978_03680 [Candidatus Dojkabacteria bacterium]|nr:hypothetical protein [Candidatus Dojkabacteria bacterium]